MELTHPTDWFTATRQLLFQTVITRFPHFTDPYLLLPKHSYGIAKSDTG